MIPALPMFTAARIAGALGRDKRSLLRVLQRTPASGKVLVQGGQLADAWTVESLPANYGNELKKLAGIKSCRDVVHLLTDGFTRWKPPIALADLEERHITKASRLKNALSRALALYVNPRAGIQEIRQIAWEDYQKEFGVVCERTARRAFDRVIERDAGEEKFDDLALYLDDRLSSAKEKGSLVAGLLAPHEQAIFRYLGSVQRPLEPTVAEQDLIWFAVCESMHGLIEAGTSIRAARKSILKFLGKSAVNLSKNGLALKKLLKRKYARYVECAGDFEAMRDQRSEKSGWKRALTLEQEDRQLIVAHAALQTGGRVAQAFRELREDGKLDGAIELHHTSNPASKSYVPRSIRDQVQPDVKRLENMTHGPRMHRLKGAYLSRDYSTMAAGDWYQADDVTLPVYFYEETDRGPVRMRGQFLVMIDVRTDYILGFLLISERNYDSLAIRSLITVCAAKHGLPRRGFYFERGIWKSSRIIAGAKNSVPFEVADAGLRRLGMDLRHALLPRGKVIERTIGQIQNRMEGFPGYAGRDERNDVRERAQRMFHDIDAGRRPINECLFSKTEFCKKLSEIIEDHNTEVQQGKRLAGCLLSKLGSLCRARNRARASETNGGICWRGMCAN